MTETTSPPAPTQAPAPPPWATFVGGFLMGSADVVPGVSGGTVALVLGIYERLVAEIRLGAGAMAALVRGDLRSTRERLGTVSWAFLLPLLAGIVVAFGSLASLLEHLLEEEPVALSAVFLGLVAGSVVVGVRLFRDPGPGEVVLGVVSAIVTFALLGLRTGRIADPSLLAFALGGAVGICAMILPGISGSFILLLVGLYDGVIGAISDRDLLVVASVGLGAVLGLASFSTVLHWLLEHHHDRVLAVLVGLMAGSLRVLWPWPAGEDGVGDTALGAPGDDVVLAVLLAAVGAAVVLVVARLGDRLHWASDRDRA